MLAGVLLLGMLAGACAISYSVGSARGALTTHLIWDLNDVYSSKRYAPSSLTKEEVLQQIHAESMARHKNIMEHVRNSWVQSFLAARDPGFQRGVEKLNTQ